MQKAIDQWQNIYTYTDHWVSKVFKITKEPAQYKAMDIYTYVRKKTSIDVHTSHAFLLNLTF